MTKNIYFLFISSSFISKTFGDILAGKTRTPQIFTGPVEPVEVFFLLARSRFGEFLLAWGHRFTVSFEPCSLTSETKFGEIIRVVLFPDPTISSSIWRMLMESMRAHSEYLTEISYPICTCSSPELPAYFCSIFQIFPRSLTCENMSKNSKVNLHFSDKY